MQIDNAANRGKSPKMSAFPRHTRQFTEPVSATQDKIIGPGKTVPDIIRDFYPQSTPLGMIGRFAFLDRDNKERSYDPGKEDKYVFKSMKSLSEFSAEAKRLIDVLNKMWVELGLPLIKDKDRDIDVPDSKVAWDALQSNHPLHNVVKRRIKDVYYIIANADIMKKACVVRTVNAGWWIVSYKGKTANDLSYFSTSLEAHKRAFRIILSSEKGKKIVSDNWNHASDPIDTNPGYPFFTSQLDGNGNPVSRIKTVELFADIKRKAGWDWEKLLTLVDQQAGKFGMSGFPFCVAALRRQQPGYKWQHQFNVTPSGMRSAFDERGVNSQRVAWMVPYVYNVLLTPLQVVMKSVRMLLPGLYHDGEAKTLRVAQLKKQASSRQLWLAEADYSNYDRFIPTDMIRLIVSELAGHMSNSQYWIDAGMYLHDKASLVWPDYSSVTDGNGWLFKPGLLGLMSGVKATSEAGTLVNSVINAEVLARTYNWNVEKLTSYLTQYTSRPVGSAMEFYYVQSDDTQLIATNPSVLYKQGNLFMEAVKAAGLKGDIELADRFLMRHTQDGCDRPVAARVWQNTLSNESAPPSELIFLAGLVSRTDGLFGIKSVDPFSTGENQPVSPSEAIFTAEVIKSLIKFISSSSHPSQVGLQFLTTMLESGGSIPPFSVDGKDFVTGNFSKAALLREKRAYISKLLATDQLSSLSALGDLSSIYSFIYGLYKDRNIPSAKLMLDQLLELNPSLLPSLKVLGAKEEAFFKYASNRLGVTGPSLD